MGHNQNPAALTWPPSFFGDTTAGFLDLLLYYPDRSNNQAAAFYAATVKNGGFVAPWLPCEKCSPVGLWSPRGHILHEAHGATFPEFAPRGHIFGGLKMWPRGCNRLRDRWSDSCPPPPPPHSPEDGKDPVLGGGGVGGWGEGGTAGRTLPTTYRKLP